ncbi:glucose 1-dehydrogenase [Porticoccaceae bacterium]|jgi:NAD(P)-dependent dehydrogenase (short-subunit alcohol dehydrogenase family)|nr:glucose 1-dehydrogenase [Porticoccaceae bacterium]MDB4426953.1 glucose 1-dehydrogenase [Porticoccaceae bacterium]MDB4580874.1 glucose 1-dehydrogenase [Porticoccaceae bacterium]MDB9737172.1 glucose 1-dehydrogenase [Porticoccaceae bacterium]MDC0517491.1 glucose 1-dehydrogenase [Porticoccaceae bacterium]
MSRLAGKTVVITGAGRGIGAAMAERMAQEGANVVVTDVLDTKGTVEAITESGGSAIGISVDVTSDDNLAAMVEATEKAFGSLDILVNNASIFAALQPKPFMQIDNDEFDKVMTVNARGVHQATRAVVPAMLRAGGGKIVNIASGTFYYGAPGLSHYTASKGAVIALTRCHGRELGDKNIQVNAIAPGLTESEALQGNTGFDPARAPTVQSRSIKREMLPEDLLGTLMYLITPDSNFVTGQTLNVDGGKVNL